MIYSLLYNFKNWRRLEEDKILVVNSAGLVCEGEEL
jgi:hypothetical protein